MQFESPTLSDNLLLFSTASRATSPLHARVFLSHIPLALRYKRSSCYKKGLRSTPTRDCAVQINVDAPAVLYLNPRDNHHSGSPISDFAVICEPASVCLPTISRPALINRYRYSG